MKKLLGSCAKAALMGLMLAGTLYLVRYGLSAIELNSGWEYFRQALLVLLQKQNILLIAAGFALFLFLLDFLEDYPAVRVLGCIGLAFLAAGGGIAALPQLQQQVGAVLHDHARQQAIQDAKENLILEDAQLFELEGLPLIQVVSSNPVDYDWLNSIASQALYTQPAFLLEKCSSIIFMDEASFSASTGRDSLSNVVGLSNSADMSVKILIQDFNTRYIDKSLPDYVMEPMDYYINTITHELSHLYDYQAAYSQSFLSDQPEFQTIYEDYSQTIGDYAASDVHEFFAEGSKLYLLYPDYLSSHCYALYDYFQNLYHCY